MQTPFAQSLLSWSHYLVLLQVGDQQARERYENEARYSTLHVNNQLFAAKYKTYLPSEEELKAEIERQKTFFYLQKGKK